MKKVFKATLILFSFALGIASTGNLSAMERNSNEEEEEETQEPAQPTHKRPAPQTQSQQTSSERQKTEIPQQESKQETELATNMLFAAINNNDLAGVQNAISNGADVNAYNTIQNYVVTPLIRAIMKLDYAQGDSEIIKLLIDNGADVNQPAGDIVAPPLHYAILNENKNLLLLLIKNGASIDSTDKIRCMLPIHVASELIAKKAWMSEGLIVALVRYGAKINAQHYKTSWQSLDFLYYKSDRSLFQLFCLSAFKMLLYLGATVNTENTPMQYKHTLPFLVVDDPIWQAFFSDNAEEKMLTLLNGLVQNETLTLKDQQCPETALCLASARGYTTIVNFILNHFQQHLTQDSLIQALHIATLNDHLAITKIIYSYLDSNSISIRGVGIALISAAAQAHNDILLFLLNSRSQIPIDSAALQEALIRCAYANNIPGLTILFKEIDTQDPTWLNAINNGVWIAALRGNLDTLTFILDQYNSLNLNLNLDLKSPAHRILLLLKNKHMSTKRRERYRQILNLLVSSARSHPLRQLIFYPILARQDQEGVPQPIPPQLTYMPRGILANIARYLA